MVPNRIGCGRADNKRTPILSGMGELIVCTVALVTFYMCALSSTKRGWGCSTMIITSVKSSRTWYEFFALLHRIGGPLILIGAAAAIIARYLSTSPDAVHCMYFVVLISLIVTVLYSFLFLIAPELSWHRGLEGAGVVCLAALLLLAGMTSTLLISVYIDLTFLDVKSYEKAHAVLATAAIFKAFFGEAAGISFVIRSLVYFHFLLFVLFFFLIDIVFAICLPNVGDKLRFKRVILFVDIPIICAILGTLAIKHGMENPKSPELSDAFEAGAIAFQLVSGTIAAYLLDNLWKRYF